MIRLVPDFPVRFLFFPCSPFSALYIFLYLKSINVFLFIVDLMITDPPFPPSPPSGPPLSTNFSLLKLIAPSPPFAPLLYTLT
jgi:hypothetical protein